MNNKTKKQRKRRKRTVLLLVLLSLVMTSGTFAYWASEVEGARQTTTGTLSVGSASSVDTSFEVTNALNTGGKLVPIGQLLNSGEGSVEAIDLAFDVKWVEDEETSQMEGTKTTGEIEISYEIILFVDGEVLDYSKNKKVYKLVNLLVNENNPEELVLDEDPETFSFQITLDEPNKKKDYNILAEAEILVIFTYEINSDSIETTDLD